LVGIWLDDKQLADYISQQHYTVAGQRSTLLETHASRLSHQVIMA
jgi:hypothetical protein